MKLQSLLADLGEADMAGIQSIEQFKSYLRCCLKEGKTLNEIAGIETKEQYAMIYARYRKLMHGSPIRGGDGLDLIRYDGHPSRGAGLQKPIVLTSKGRALKEAIIKNGQNNH
ncbi:MAG: hypothetical protein KDJ38_00210 [Gammaproteobacteria bacterium]|nr:hypothetical protein [Gammaproteobacteria bacterium]